MIKLRNFLWLTLLLALIIPGSIANAENGVDDFRGRWDIQWQMDSQGSDLLPDLKVLVTETEASPTEEHVYLAAGCMAITDEGLYAPLALRAQDNLDGTYAVSFLSTVVPGVNDLGPFIIRFEGLLEVVGKGVSDDVIGGQFVSSHGGGDWFGVHHDRRRVKCPAADPNVLYFDPDVYMERERSPNPSPDYTLFGGSTNIVSSAMQVEIPDGRVAIAGYDQDIFSAHIDFINEFAFGLNLEETPIVGQPYTITLLDNLGNPIPGTETVDYWYSCPQGAPTQLMASYDFEKPITLSWTGATDVPGQFEPGGDPQIGFYQVEVGPFEVGGMLYGMNHGRSTYHSIPWFPFVPDQEPDTPDGVDAGVAFSEFDDGLYEFRVLTFSESLQDTPGFGLECQSVMTSQNLYMEKKDSDLNFFQFGVISGTVTDEQGMPLEGIQVVACEYDNEQDPYCQEAYTDSSGAYSIQSLFENDYRVSVFEQEGWINQYFDDASFYEDAVRVPIMGGQVTAAIDFALIKGGAISGTVFDADTGDALGGIAVDTESGGYGTCTAEDGTYVLQGLPVGQHNVVAGRDFCGPHPYGEQLLEAVEVGSLGIDFYLSVPPEPSSQYLNVQPDHGWADSGGWTIGSEVTLSFADFSATQAAVPSPGGEDFGTVWFDLSDSGIAPDTNVTVTDGISSKDLLVVQVTFDEVNAAENSASGTGPGGAPIGVGLVDTSGTFFWVDGGAVADNGTWMVDLPPEGDFSAVMDAWVHVFDEDGDSTLAHYVVIP